MEKLVKALERPDLVVITTAKIHSTKSEPAPSKVQFSLLNHSAKYILYRFILHNVCNLHYDSGVALLHFEVRLKNMSN